MVIFAVIAESAFYVVQISGIFAEITQVYDITMIGYSIGTIFMFVAIFRCDLLGTSEIAREFMIDRLSEGIVAVDNDGVVQYFNEPAKRLYPELKMLSGKIPSEVINAVRGSENITLDEHIYKVDQNPLIRGGESFGILYALVDETEHIRYLQELEKQKNRADSANQAKSAFLANMSHDIRTPINAVLGMNEMILRECDDSDILGYSEKIRSSGNTLLGLINDILDFSKIEAGKLDIIPVDYDLTSVLNDLVSMIQLRAEAKGLTLETRFDGNIPKLLHGDEIRIKQIVTNILTNAVKYTEKGSVTFALTYEKLSEESILLKVSVSDTGIGIKQEDIPKLFSAFDRIEEERNRSIEGTGLGMSITQRLLAMMGSRLEVASEYGKGSEFSFAIEQKVISYEPVGDFEEALRRSIANRKKYREKFTAPDAHILVVDDTPMNLEVFVNLLKKTLVRIDTAASGSECIALAAKKKYDVIFLDHMMPDKNGIETLKELKASAASPNADTPAICLTANTVSGARETYLNAGFDDYLTKPVEPEKLEKMIMEYLPEEKIIQVTEEISGRSVSSSGRSAVLVVDDDELIRKNAESILRPSYDIICADSGKTAIETAERERPDLIGEIDVRNGLLHCGTEQIYTDTLTAFAEAVGEQTDVIEQYWNARDIESLTIKVHAIKSTSRIIGAEDIGTLAERLEKAGHDNDITALENGMDELLTRCRSLGRQLKPLVKADDDSALPPISPEELSELYGIIREFYSVADYDSFTQMIENLGSYRIPDSEKERCRALREAADALDYDLIPEILDKE